MLFFSWLERIVLVHTFRRETGDKFFFQPGFERAASAIHDVFEDLFEDKMFLGQPAAVCTDVPQMIERIVKIHDRPVKHINVGVDDGKGENSCELFKSTFLEVGYFRQVTKLHVFSLVF